MFLLMYSVPFLVFLGLGSVFATNSNDFRLLVALFLVAGIIAFVASFSSFLVVQYNDCGKIQDTNKAASSAGMALVVQFIVLTIVYFVAPLRHIVSNLLPPDIDSNISDGLSYGYYSAFAGVFSILMSTNLASVCS
jgi:hypothetical protein